MAETPPEQEKQPSGLEKMVEKAKVISRSSRVTRIDHNTFQVVGDHGIYIVIRGVDGLFHCGCQGFLTRGFCSHALAVNMLVGRRRPRPRREAPSPEPEQEKSEGEEPTETEDTS
jgi:hypothetical protein